MMDSLGHTWIVHGKSITPFSDEDVYELIRENVCDDCAYYVKSMIEIDPEELLYNLSDDELINKGICSGECDKVQEIQSECESVLNEIKDLAMEVYNKILEGYTPGCKRTKKEQFALDKVIAIHNLILKHT